MTAYYRHWPSFGLDTTHIHMCKHTHMHACTDPCQHTHTHFNTVLSSLVCQWGFNRLYQILNLSSQCHSHWILLTETLHGGSFQPNRVQVALFTSLYQKYSFRDTQLHILYICFLKIGTFNINVGCIFINHLV